MSNQGQKCHPTWLPLTLGVNGQRFGSFVPKFISAHAWCSKRTEMSSHMATRNSWGKWTTFWIVFAKLHFCACVVFKKGQKCHPTWQPETLGVNRQRFKGCLPIFVSAHAPCRKKGQKCHPTWPTSTLGLTTERFGTFLRKFLCAHPFCGETQILSHTDSSTSWGI